MKVTLDKPVFRGELCVYREHSGMDRLSAYVLLDDGRKLYYHPAPKRFTDLITDGQKNVISVEFKAEGDGSYPHAVRALSESKK